MKAIVYDEFGPAENLKWKGDVELPHLNDNEVLLKVSMTAVNRADIVQRTGKYPPPKGVTDILGLECVGEIVESLTATEVTTDGHNYMALLPGGGYAEFAKVHRDHMLRVPTSLTISEAAAVMEVWITAYQLLIYKANIQPGDVVMVYGAASGVGTAAIQIIKERGGIPIAVVGSEKKELFCTELGAEMCVNYKTDENFHGAVKALTEGRGVDVILDCIGASNFAINQKLITTGGRWILYGLMGGNSVQDANLGLILVKNINIMGSTLRSKSNEYKKELISDFSQYAFPKFANEELIPIIDSVFPIKSVVDAHKHVEANKNIGKVLLDLSEDSAW